MIEKLRVLVVEDSIIYRRILAAAVEGTNIAVAAQSASNGVIALEKIKEEKFDVVLMDVNMPELDGIETLVKVKLAQPKLPVIMISSIGGKNAEITLRALQLGAIDFIIKPLEQDYESNMIVLKTQLKTLFTQIRMNNQKPSQLQSSSEINHSNAIAFQKMSTLNKTKLSGIDLVVIASSTGGPVAVEKVIGSIGKNFIKPILIVQHMPPEFTHIFAEALDRKSHMNILEGKNDITVRAGQVLIAPGGYHMVVEKGAHTVKKITLHNGPTVNGVRPAADVLFKSVAKEYAGSRVLVIILTGMGRDGTEGVAELKKLCKCYCIAQSEETCVVYGMPRSIVESGLCDEILGIDEIAKRIQEIENVGG